jgi:hypothetical protein
VESLNEFRDYVANKHNVRIRIRALTVDSSVIQRATENVVESVDDQRSCVRGSWITTESKTPTLTEIFFQYSVIKFRVFQELKPITVKSESKEFTYLSLVS